MKKIFIGLVFLVCICSSSFARINLETSFIGPGFFSEGKQNCFSSSGEDEFESYPFFIGGIYVDLGWEFDTDTIKPVHYYIGPVMGFGVGGIYLGLKNSLSISAFDFDYCRMEVNVSLEAGYYSFIMYSEPGINMSVGFSLMPANRRGLILNFGIENSTTGSINYYVDYGLNYNFISYTGLYVGCALKI